MMIIAVSGSEKSDKEVGVVHEMFKNGLDVFHLRKFNCSGKYIENYIRQIPKVYWNRIVLHTHHRFFLKYGLKGIHISERHKRKKFSTWIKLLYYRFRQPDLTVTTSFQNILKINKSRNNYTYVFLNSRPDSLSLKKNSMQLGGNNINNILKKTKYPVMAMGGVRYNNLEDFYIEGFSGICLKGALWESQDPLDSFVKIKQKCYEIEFQVKKEFTKNAFQ